MINIVIADDHELMREGLKMLLAEQKDICIVAEAANGDEVIQLLKQKKFDVLLLDISMPGRNGLEVLHQIKRKKTKLPVLMLSVFPEEQYAIRALRSGAAGYLTKASATSELIEAIRKVAEGERYITTSIAENLAKAIGVDYEQPAHELLSNREYEVMRLIAQGHSVKEISERLQLSVKTISTYRRRILDKMRAKNNADIIRYALEHQIT